MQVVEDRRQKKVKKNDIRDEGSLLLRPLNKEVGGTKTRG